MFVVGLDQNECFWIFFKSECVFFSYSSINTNDIPETPENKLLQEDYDDNDDDNEEDQDQDQDEEQQRQQRQRQQQQRQRQQQQQQQRQRKRRKQCKRSN
jgi:hypothetical protein